MKAEHVSVLTMGGETCKYLRGAPRKEGKGCVTLVLLEKGMIQSVTATLWNFKCYADVKSLIRCEN